MKMIEPGIGMAEKRITYSSYSIPPFFLSVKEKENDSYQKSKEKDTTNGEKAINTDKELLPLTTDWVFKRVFSDINCETSLLFLLQTILKTDCKGFEYLPGEVPRKDPDSKTVMYDISAKLDNGIRVDIEMNPYFKEEVIDRILFYGTELMVLKKGKNNYHTLNKCAVIVFIHDTKHFFPHPVSGYVLGEWNSDTSHILTDKLIYYFVDMNRIADIEKCKENEDLISLLKLLTCTRREEMESIIQRNEFLKPAGEKLAQLSDDPAERAFAIARDKFLWDQEAKERGAEKRGREEGRKEGRKEGIIKTAKAMLAAGVDIETVCKATGLSRSDVID